MITKELLKRISDNIYEVPQSTRADMRVPARIFADDQIIEAALGDRAIEQLINTTTLPGVVKYTLAMPDIHQGYGPPIGAVIPVDPETGVISPGATGYDINCGVRLLRSELKAADIADKMEALVGALFEAVPSGVGRDGNIRLSDAAMDSVLAEGCSWAVREGYGTTDDLQRSEEQGHMTNADPVQVSVAAKSRGRDQVGTLGSGNHFVEIGEVAEIFDPAVAETFGLFLGQVVVWIHTGSRGLGHQVCTDYVKLMQKSVKAYNIQLPDRELVCAPFSSPEGQAYFGAMAAAANFAWANRQVLTHRVRGAFAEVLSGTGHTHALDLLYDVAHNIVKRETHLVDGLQRDLLIHRKGATRAFGPGAPDLPAEYRTVGQPVMVPGDMGSESYVLVGAPGAMEQSFGSACHGAGRAMSRSAVAKLVRGEELQARLRAQGIFVRGGSWDGLAEEAPEAYKNVSCVVNVVHNAGLARKVARTIPRGVIKG